MEGDKPASETPVKEESETPTKETPMAEDFREAAKRAGYALVPEADFEGYKKDREALKQVRSIFPEEARGKEADFFKSVTEKAGQVDQLQERVKSVEQLAAENETLKAEKADLTRGKKLSDMWGHLSRIQTIRNVRVHDRFIDEQKLVDFPLEKHDLSKPEAVEKLAEAVWKDVLEPAYKEQTSIIEQVAGRPSPRREEPRRDVRDSPREYQDEPADDPGKPKVFGGLA